MRGIARWYDAAITGLAFAGGAVLAAIFLAIVYDVTVRTVGLRSPLWTVSLAEYGLLYATLLAAPWVLRRKSHVFITILTSRLSRAPRRVVEHTAYAAGLLVCLLLAYVSLTVAIDEYQRGIVDIRSFRIPFWIVTAPMPLSFLLLTVEFGRFLFGADSMLDAKTREHEGL